VSFPRVFFLRMDVIVNESRPERGKRRVVVVTKVDNFDNLVSSGDGR